MALWNTSTCCSVCKSVFVFVLFPEFGLSWPEGESAQEVSAISLCVHINFFFLQLKQTTLFRSYRVHRKRVLSQQKARPSVTITGRFCYDCSDLMLDAEVIKLRGLDIFTLLSNRGWFSALTSSAADTPTEQAAVVTFKQTLKVQQKCIRPEWLRYWDKWFPKSLISFVSNPSKN